MMSIAFENRGFNKILLKKKTYSVQVNQTQQLLSYSSNIKFNLHRKIVFYQQNQSCMLLAILLLIVQSASKYTVLQTISGLGSSPFSVSMSLDGTRVVSGDRSLIIYNFNSTSKQYVQVQNISEGSTNIFSTALASDNYFLLSGGASRVFRIYTYSSASSNYQLAQSITFSDSVREVFLTSDSTYFGCVTTVDFTTRIFKRTTGTDTFTSYQNLTSTTDYLSGAIARNGSYLASTGRGGSVVVYKRNSTNYYELLQTLSTGVDNQIVNFSPDATRLLVGDTTGIGHIYKFNSTTSLFEAFRQLNDTAFNSNVEGIQMNTDNTIVVTASSDNYTRFYTWNGSDFAKDDQFTGGKGKISVSMTLNGTFVVDASNSARALVIYVPCTAYLSNCLVCSSITNCTSCAVGYTLDASTGNCVACNSTLNYCSECSSKTSCTKCIGDTFTLSGGVCYCTAGSYPNTTTNSCASCPVNCTACTSPTACTTCNTGSSFILSGSTCPCQSFYYLSGSSCSPCSSGCLVCTSANDCSSCDASSNLVLSGGICVCATGYYMGEGCTKCVSNCDICDNSDNCSTCASGYFITANSQCDQCISNCASCTTASNCDRCVPGMVLSGGTCVSCGVTNCITCSSVGVCTACVSGFSASADGSTCECSTGYTKVTESSCQACNTTLSSCITCTSTSVCTSCDTGYVLSGETCLLDSYNNNQTNSQTNNQTNKQPSNSSGASQSYFRLVLIEKDPYSNSIVCYFIVVSADTQKYLGGIANNQLSNVLQTTPSFGQNTDYAYDPSLNVLTAKTTYTSQKPLQDQTLNLEFSPSASYANYLQTMSKTSLAFAVSPSNNLLASAQTPENYSKYKVISSLASCIAYISMFFFLLSLLLPLKYIGVEMTGVVQLSYLALVALQPLPAALGPVSATLDTSSGFNTLFRTQKSTLAMNSVPASLSAVYLESPFAYNLNYSLLLVVVPILVAAVCYALSKKQLCLQGKVTPQKLATISKRALGEYLLTGFLFLQYLATAAAAASLKYDRNKPNTEVTVFGIIQGIILLACGVLTAVLLKLGSSNQSPDFMGCFVQAFTPTSFSRHYYFFYFFSRLTFGLSLILALSTPVPLVLPMLFALANLIMIAVKLPYKQRLDNYRQMSNETVSICILVIYLCFKYTYLRSNPTATTDITLSLTFVVLGLLLLVLITNGAFLIWGVVKFLKNPACNPKDYKTNEKDFQELLNFSQPQKIAQPDSEEKALKALENHVKSNFTGNTNNLFQFTSNRHHLRIPLGNNAQTINPELDSVARSREPLNISKRTFDDESLLEDITARGLDQSKIVRNENKRTQRKVKVVRNQLLDLLEHQNDQISENFDAI